MSSTTKVLGLALGRTVFFLLVAIGIFSVFFTIYSSAMHGFKSGDWKPLLHDTVGRFVASDLLLNIDVTMLKEKGGELSVEEVKNYQVDAWVNAVIIGLFLWGIFKLLVSFHGEAQYNLLLGIMVGLLVIGLFGLGHVWYLSHFFDTEPTKSLYPGVGVTKFVKDGLIGGLMFKGGAFSVYDRIGEHLERITGKEIQGALSSNTTIMNVTGVDGGG